MLHPKTDILFGPTPLEPAVELSKQLGIDLHIKRDDLAGPSFGGNKSRQLEYYFGAALAQDSDTILITGAVQSNFTRTAVAVARARGMRAIVQFEGPGEEPVGPLPTFWKCVAVPPDGSGNRVLS
jgi:1-aminocyclopropane-1-carboxylate deaminase/D-cysteine desulfhydrase-like pyridoxal-dependent ACC family enzyme